jgi:hypothetical protein
MNPKAMLRSLMIRVWADGTLGNGERRRAQREIETLSDDEVMTLALYTTLTRFLPLR